MQHILYILLSILVAVQTSFAQSSWLLTETLDPASNWNHPYYAPYNTADKLILKQRDSSTYCMDCNLSVLIWNGIESNKIVAYQLDKTAALVIQKSILLKKKLLTFVSSEKLSDALHKASITIYRREIAGNAGHIKDLSIEWIAVNMHIHETDFIFYVKAKDAFPFLKNNACYWVHPYNIHYTATLPDALAQHNYIAQNYTVVSVYNLQQTKTFTISSIPLLQKLTAGAQPFYANPTSSKSDTLLVYLNAMCSADTRDKFNRGYYKVQLPALLLKLYAEKKLNGYAFHEAGYFTPITATQLKERMVVEYEEDGEYSIKRMDPNSLTAIHILKTQTKSASFATLKNEWLLLGMSTDISTDFTNMYVIAFSFDDVIRLLSATPVVVWYNGTNETDSMSLAEALRTQRIAYNSMHITNIFTDTIVTISNDVSYKQQKSGDALVALYYEQCTALLTDFDPAHKRIIRPTKNKVESFELHYAFNNLPNNIDIAASIIEGIKTNKLTTYKDADLHEPVNSMQVISMLDKARFYKTGNAKKDSIYISKLPLAERYIQPAQLTEYTLHYRYKTINDKNAGSGISFGIMIPAELNPQYEQETLCYVSYPALIKYLSSSKTAKKYIPQLKNLSNEKAIVEVLDFYGIQRYPLPDSETRLPIDLPVFVRERVK